MKNSKIEWTDDSSNPIMLKGGGFYCYKVSEGCTNCYAEGMARRVACMQGGTPQPYTNRRTFPELILREDILESWKKKTSPKRIFCSSMTDIFGEFVPDEWVFKILDAAHASVLTFQFLTKRAVRMYELCMKWLRMRRLPIMPKNMWMGISVENQRRCDERLPLLLQLPAVIRWISAEPLLGKVHIPHHKLVTSEGHLLIHWIVAGGESGSKARPMHPDWPMLLKYACKSAGVAFFYKQWGTWAPEAPADYNGPFTKWSKHTKTFRYVRADGTGVPYGMYDPSWNAPDSWWMAKVGKKYSGAEMIDGETIREFPKNTIWHNHNQ